MTSSEVALAALTTIFACLWLYQWLWNAVYKKSIGKTLDDRTLRVIALSQITMIVFPDDSKGRVYQELEAEIHRLKNIEAIYEEQQKKIRDD